MRSILYLLLMLSATVATAQSIVVDPQHLLSVTQNAVVRSSAESTHANYLGKINDNLNDLNTNMASVVIAQNMIYNALANVNSALKNGLAVRNIATIIGDMQHYIGESVKMARDEPYLLVFTEGISEHMRTRAVTLANDVSGFILKEGDNMLADFNARDQLLRRVTQQLQILSSLAYGGWKAMYWAKERGVIRSLNPFAGFIDQDRAAVERILLNAKYLKP
ncbi:hypothetical protein ABDD95_12545 [Mucilaginibacter sp. PAMB04274]|uniref:hypothetical protein n=1 Tax=Mucilaginibacter sp. PAMB04274 TaxID=3138568 RepID=UPI0031F60454